MIFSERRRKPRRSSLTRNLVHLGLGQVGTTILTILLSATLARLLGASDFGLLYLLTSIATFTFVIAEWSQGAILIREAARNHDTTGDLLGSTLLTRVAFALVGCVCVFAGLWVLGYDLRTRLLGSLLILCWLPQYLAYSIGWAFRAWERMDRDAVLNITIKLAMLLVTITCLELGGGLSVLVLTWAVAGSAGLAMGLFIYRRLHMPRIAASASTMRVMFLDGAPLVVMSLTVFLEPLINTNILYRLTSSTVVGWYGASWTIAGSLLAPATVLGWAMYPRLSIALDDKAEFRATFDKSFRLVLLLAVLGAVGTYLFANVPVKIIYGENFAAAATNLRAFAPVLLLMYVDIFLGLAAVALGRTTRLAIAKVVAVVVSAVAAFAFVPYSQERFGNGGLGVMFALTFGELLMLTANAILVPEIFDRRAVGNVCRSLGAGAATLLLFQLLPHFTPLLGIPLCVIVFAGAAMLTGAVTKSEVETLLGNLRKKRERPTENISDPANDNVP
jgi:O-antigen/teichoic acid export membrane protein